MEQKSEKLKKIKMKLSEIEWELKTYSKYLPPQIKTYYKRTRVKLKNWLNELFTEIGL